MSGLRCTGVLYQGGVSGSSLRTVWCKAAHFGAWPRASVGLGNASFPATPSAPHPHPARPRSAAWERPPGTGWLGDGAPVTPPRGRHHHPAFLGDGGAERQGQGLDWGC